MLFVRLRSEYGNYSISEIALALWVHWASSEMNYDFEGEVSTMIELGSRYRNIDEHLGYGASLVLGTALSETM